MNAKIKKMAIQYAKVKKQELREAKSWINKGISGAIWHWDSEKKQESSLEGSYEFFLSKTDQRTDDAIILFVGQEIYDLWDGYPEDSIEKRCNHAKALYNYIKSRVDNSIAQKQIEKESKVKRKQLIEGIKKSLY